MQKATSAPLSPNRANGTPAPLSFDRPFHAAMARATAGLSPEALSQAYVDWAQHFWLSPDKQIELAERAFRGSMHYLQFCHRAMTDPDCELCVERTPGDQRFMSAAWKQWPYSGISQAFLVMEQWWRHATTGIRGVSRHHEDVVSFVARQLLDTVSPSNFLLTNPEVLERTAEQGGMNLIRGLMNLGEDVRRTATGEKSAAMTGFEAGRNLAVTPGKVVARNRLMELIQYSPATSAVYAEPILIIPAWIMKYYILDLSPQNSLVKYLTGKGHTVFMVSWRNPGGEDSNLDLEDYLTLGVDGALDAVAEIVPERRVHAAGYCLGGTLLSMAAAAAARDGDKRLASITLLAAQTDFTEAGELMLFIDEAQVSYLEDMMADQGYLDSSQMSGAFQILRSNDLVWSRLVREYLMGERQPAFDLMAWNADSTRMPARMHSTYLRRLFLNNELAAGHFTIGGRPVSLRDIRIPVFAVSTLSDHVAPWRSVYKIQALTDASVTFVLSNGGHNAGIVNPPGNSKRFHQIATHEERENYVDPDAWQRSATHHEGSWWPCWQSWLMKHSSKNRVAPPSMGAPDKGLAPLCDAPGEYVHGR